jgi:uncharacterized LabA/DUF88 family protein
MRVCVFVDGENLRHTIVNLFDPTFDRRDYLPKSADWTRFFDMVVDRATEGRGERLRSYWYVSEYFDAYPKPQSARKRSPDELERWAKRNAHLLRAHGASIPADVGRTERLIGLQDDLTGKLRAIRGRFDGFTALQNGIAAKHRAVEFRRSGAIPYNLFTLRFGQEKTVDVNLGVDMVMLQANYDLAIIVSGDQDYVPAAQAVKNLGKPVVNVAFKARNGVLLPGGARRLNQATDWSITFEWEEFRDVLGVPMPTAADGAGMVDEPEDEE